MQLTHIGGPTLLLEVGGWRLLTDPTFDPPGKRYFFGWGTMSRKLAGPAVTPEDLGPLDAVLLTHDHHADNLDPAGRALLPGVPRVLTTTAGASRLGGQAVGLGPWQSTVLEAPGRPTIRVTGTPARHGPPGSRPIVGQVTGFLLEHEEQEHGAVWVSGDTVLYDGLREVAERFDVGTAVLHLGGVTFPWLSGRLRYTMTAERAIALCDLLEPQTVVPVHYEGWRHFTQRPEVARSAFAQSRYRDRVQWLEPGTATEIVA
jgi:L-ascorbate metabolism protein UlaG (beta-lactamase superfamily)